MKNRGHHDRHAGGGHADHTGRSRERLADALEKRALQLLASRSGAPAR
jgi:hypothetical protein